ncbi:MAG: FeoB-associated Cys-rich membrane protein [Clostridia bacterium]|nr:FeoB-associated Cys-rich membrane protein [Clostridia bacterium]
MLDFLQQNWGTIVVVAVIAAIVCAIVVSRIRARKQGKSTCGCGCDQCAMSGICHSAPKAKQKGKTEANGAEQERTK